MTDPNETPEQELARLRAAAARRASAARANLARALQSDRIGRPRKLTAAQVAAIARRRQRGEPARELAREYGVSVATIYGLFAAQRLSKPP